MVFGDGGGVGGGGGRGRTLGTRMVGVAALEERVFSDIDDDPFAQFQSLQIVLLAAVSSLIGLSFNGPGLGLAAALVLGVRWWLMAKVLVELGNRWLPAHLEPVTQSRTLRVIGYAQTPMFLALLFPIPIVGVVIWIIINAWTIAAMNVGVKQLLPGVPLSRYGWLLGAAAIPQVVLLIIALVSGGV